MYQKVWRLPCRYIWPPGRKAYALWASLVSGLAEPLGAALGYFILAPYMSETVYGLIFGVIGGVMVYLALDEIIADGKALF